MCENINLVIFRLPRRSVLCTSCAALCSLPGVSRNPRGVNAQQMHEVKNQLRDRGSVRKTSNSPLCGLVALFDKSASSAFFHFTDLTDQISKAQTYKRYVWGLIVVLAS